MHLQMPKEVAGVANFKLFVCVAVSWPVRLRATTSASVVWLLVHLRVFSDKQTNHQELVVGPVC